MSTPVYFQLEECGVCHVKVLNVRMCHKCERLFCVRCNSGQATTTVDYGKCISVGGKPTCIECFCDSNTNH